MICNGLILSALECAILSLIFKTFNMVQDHSAAGSVVIKERYNEKLDFYIILFLMLRMYQSQF